MFTKAYAEEIHESEQSHNSIQRLCVILDTKYKKANLNKVMKNQCQHLIEVQRNELLKLLQKIEELFDWTIGTWKTNPVDFELKEYENPICSRPYSVPKVHKKNFKRRLNIYLY